MGSSPLVSTSFLSEEECMRKVLRSIGEQFKGELSLIKTQKGLEELRVRYLGKKSKISGLLKTIGEYSAAERPVLGELVNDLKDSMQSSIVEKKEEISKNELEEKIKKENVDVTEPGKSKCLGCLHPLSLVTKSMCSIFSSMGFSIVDGPEIETDYYNFEALNMPSFHPSRDTQDTFYLDEGLLLRTQTTSVQVRIMEKERPPIRMICPGKVFRADDIDSTHSPIFHQLEGLVVDEGVAFSDLKGTLEYFIKEFYGQNTKVRFRPHNFPYTEPSAELDIECFSCKGKGCRLCKEEGYIELLGCGMVHKDVLKRCNIDPDIYSGFAFGMGIERIAMMKYNINDIRLFYENDVRFLRQFV